MEGFFMKKNLSFYLALLLPIQIIGSFFLGKNSAFIERFYVPYVFKNLSSFWAYITRHSSLSIGFILVPLLFLALFYFLYKKFKKKQNYRWQQLVATISISYFVYLMHWGFLYNRTPLPDKPKLKMLSWTAYVKNL
jgi:cbb3-type cytochrome oxidase subunit 3